MLQLKNICKQYKTGNFVQQALDNVSLNLRDNEFVAILGPSGSGKTTLLNIIGGLDRYDSGDLIINGISTKKYSDRDWDSYRNHTIGFVFQSYNLIPHQTILANVELALTISGIGKAERTERAKKALEEVGLGEQLHKKPNQLSGGQMQRVAIARALVNDPKILLADEPTGALDSDTSVQVMDLLKRVAKNHLVVMVTHNPELAQQYATRIVNLRDGQIRADSDPYILDEMALVPPTHQNMGHSSMSFLTALSLSFNNLKTKKARTILTAFAGSIGIIGIALILSISTGVNRYIDQLEEDTLSEYPLEIDSSGIDMTSLYEVSDTLVPDDEEEEEEDTSIHVIEMISSIFTTVDSNDLYSLKEYFDSGESGIEEYVNAIEYEYNVTPQIFTYDGDDYRQVHPDSSFTSLGLGSSSSSSSLMSSYMSTDVFYELPETESLYEDQYDVVAGHWPENYDEVVLVLTSSGSISDFMLYSMGLRDSVELEDMIQAFIDEEDYDVDLTEEEYSYDEILGLTFKLVNAADYYEYDEEYDLWTDKSDDEDYMLDLVADGIDLTIVGIVQPAEDSNAYMLSTGLGYTPELTDYVIEQAQESEIVQDQIADPDINVFTGEPFGEDTDEDDFDLESLITVDEEALEEAFSFDDFDLDIDTSSFSETLSDSMDFSSALDIDTSTLDLTEYLDMSSISIELPEMGTISMDDMLDSLTVELTSEDLEQIASSIISGYASYAAENPEADYSNLATDVTSYLTSSDAWSIMEENIYEIIEANELSITVSSDQLEAVVEEIMQGYMTYAASMGYTDSTMFYDYLLEYLSTEDAQAILATAAAEILPDVEDVTITEDQLMALGSDLATGYITYAAENSLPDPTMMGEYFIDYLTSDEGQAILTSELSSLIDTDALSAQVSSSIESYMESAMTSYGSSISSALEEQISSAMTQIMTQLASSISESMETAFAEVGDNISSSLEEALTEAFSEAFDDFEFDEEAFADAFEMNMDSEDLMEMLVSLSTSAESSYDDNLESLGYADEESLYSITIYPKDFDSKEVVVNILDDYNARMQEEGHDEKVVTYTDYVGTMMTTVQDIINVVSYVLIAFVAISLIVSSIMIGVITYISVLERKKEIGILRAIGASKHNISEIFNAETFIIGLTSGVMGIGISLLLLIPINMFIKSVAGAIEIKAVLPFWPAVFLIVLSIFLSVISGLIPSKKAAKSDPVTALRTE